MFGSIKRAIDNTVFVKHRILATLVNDFMCGNHRRRMGQYPWPFQLR